MFEPTEAATRYVLWKKVVLKNFAKFTGKHLCQSPFLYKFAGMCEFCKIFKNTLFTEHAQATASERTQRKISLLEVMKFFSVLREDVLWYGKTPVTSYELLATSWKLKSTSWNSKLRVPIHELRFQIHELRVHIYNFKNHLINENVSKQTQKFLIS